jgi:hypothetical protein
MCLVMWIYRSVAIGLQTIHMNFINIFCIVQKWQAWCNVSYQGIIGPYFFEKCGVVYSNCECRAVQSRATKISAQWVTSSSARFALNPTKWSKCSYSKNFHSNLQDSVSGQNYFSFRGHHLAHPLAWPWNKPIRLIETKMHTKSALKNPRAREPWRPLDVDGSIVLKGTIKNMRLKCKLGWILSLQGRFV